MMKKLSIVFVVLLVSSVSWGQMVEFPFQNKELSVDERIEDLIGRLTLEEKTVLMVNSSTGVERLGIPPYDWWNECLHGVGRLGKATVFPQAIGMAATFNKELIGEMATAISDEARAKYNEAVRIDNRTRYGGLTFWSPNINIFRDPRWGRGQESYGEDPLLTSEIGVAFVNGLQGNNKDYLKVAACAKHFAVHSVPEQSRHHFNATPSENDLWNTYLPAFEALVNADVAGVMCAYNRLNDEPCCGNSRLLMDILRGKWGFDGYVVSDCGAISNIWKDHKTVEKSTEATAIAIQNQVNINCGTNYANIPEAIGEGVLNEEDVDVALGGALKILFQLGWFDKHEDVPFSTIGPEVVNSEEHQKLARKVATESIVLLKNDKDLLPLSKDLKYILVSGPNGDSNLPLLGNYHGMSGNMVTVFEGIHNVVSPATNIVFSKGCDFTDTTSLHVPWQAGMSDVNLAVLGLNALIEGEAGDAYLSQYGGDKFDLQLPKVQLDLLKQLSEKNKPLVVVLMSGSAISLETINKYADAVIWAGYPGEEGGNAIADILFGNENPSGRLPITFYDSVDQLPPFDDYSMKGRTYRYAKEEFAYPFGYGLSYSRFSYNKVSVAQKSANSLQLNIELENLSEREGAEVIQVYAQSKMWGDNDPVKMLIAFEKVELQAKEKKSVELVIPTKNLRVYQESIADYKVVPGSYAISVGPETMNIELK